MEVTTGDETVDGLTTFSDLSEETSTELFVDVVEAKDEQTSSNQTPSVQASVAQFITEMTEPEFVSFAVCGALLLICTSVSSLSCCFCLVTLAVRLRKKHAPTQAKHSTPEKKP